MRVGAGTVLTGTDARSAIQAGVDFLVSPTVEPDVVAVAREARCAAFIGGLTPTEILAAWRTGADVVKVFPVASRRPVTSRILPARCRASR